METLRVDIQNMVDAKYDISDELVQILLKRKNNFLAGKGTSQPWNEIKKSYKRA